MPYRDRRDDVIHHLSVLSDHGSEIFKLRLEAPIQAAFGSHGVNISTETRETLTEEKYLRPRQRLYEQTARVRLAHEDRASPRPHSHPSRAPHVGWACHRRCHPPPLAAPPVTESGLVSGRGRHRRMSFGDGATRPLSRILLQAAFCYAVR